MAGELRNAGLHAERQLVLFDAGVGLGIADLPVIHLVQGPEPVERIAAHLRRNAGWVVDVQDRIAAAAERHAGVLTREIARGPQAGLRSPAIARYSSGGQRARRTSAGCR